MNAINSTNQHANEWIIKENEGLSVTQKEERDAWLQNPHYKKVYDENKALIRECLTLDDAFINGLKAKHAFTPKPTNRFLTSRYLAASVALLFIFACGSFFGIKRYFIPTFEQTYISTDAKMLGIALPDHSTIDLDKKSSLHVRYYDTKRVVELPEGNALFSVAKDAQKPFSVQTQKTLIEVVGTKFEVLNFNDHTAINVLEGHVNVSYKDEKETHLLAELTKLESLTVNNTGKVLNHRMLDSAEIAPWRDDMIFFNKTSLKDASALFERYSETKMLFETDTLATLRVSGKFSTLRFDNFITSIELLYPIKAIKEGNVIKIVKK